MHFRKKTVSRELFSLKIQRTAGFDLLNTKENQAYLLSKFMFFLKNSFHFSSAKGAGLTKKLQSTLGFTTMD